MFKKGEYMLTVVTEVRLWDNRSLEVVGGQALDIVSSRGVGDLRGGVSVSLDLEVLTVTVRSSSRTRVWVYRLGEGQEETQQRKS